MRIKKQLVREIPVGYIIFAVCYLLIIFVTCGLHFPFPPELLVVVFFVVVGVVLVLVFI